MKKIVSLLALLCVLCSLSAQRVNETVTLLGKEQLKGFTINIDNAPMNIVENAIVDKLEKQFGLKGSKKKGFHIYENQPCSAFGEERYDIYFSTAEVGKKNNKSTQVILVVSTGNMNCITFSNDPRSARNIMQFMEGLANDVEIYKTNLRIEELTTNLANLKKERDNLLLEQGKVKDKMAATNDKLRTNVTLLDAKTTELNTLQEQFTSTHNADLKDQIAAVAKDRQTLQKEQSNLQKTLLNLNNDLHKLETKLEANNRSIEEVTLELERLQK